MQTIPFLNLSFIFLPLIFVWYFYYKWTNNKSEIIISTFRMVFQLLLIGYILVFLFEEKSLILGSSIILFMISVSTLITLRNTKRKTLEHFSKIFWAICLAGLFHLILIIVFVLDLQTIYDPRFVIPIAGMIFANNMNILSLAIERYEKEISRKEAHESAREIAFKASMIPQINALLAVGLVSLPGMMTGQILSGVDPLIAVRYQIMIMAMIISNAGSSVIIYFLMNQSK